MSPMGPDEKKKLYILLVLIGVLVVVVLVILQPWNRGSSGSTAPPTEPTGMAGGTGGTGSSTPPVLNTAGDSPGTMPAGGAMPAGDGMQTGMDMSGTGGTPPATPTGDSGGQSPTSPKRGPQERFRADPMEPFQQQLPPSALAPVISMARSPWTGQGLEGLPRIRLSDFNPPPRVPGERPANIPEDKASGTIEAQNKRLAGMMLTQSNMLWVIMEVIEETGVKYYVLKPGDMVQLQEGSFQVVRFERFQDKDDNDKENVRVVLKDLSTQSHTRVVLRPSSQPQQDQTGGMMGGEGGMGIPGMPGGMPGIPGMPGGGGKMGGDYGS